MKEYKVETSRDFFNQYVRLTAELTNLRAMFQNPNTVVTREQMIEWHGMATSVAGELEELIEDSMGKFIPL